MNIKVERIHKLETEGALKAFVVINIDDEIVLKGLRIINSKNGLFVSMPKKLAKDGKWYSDVIITREEDRKQIDEVVLSAYNAE